MPTFLPYLTVTKIHIHHTLSEQINYGNTRQNGQNNLAYSVVFYVVKYHPPTRCSPVSTSQYAGKPRRHVAEGKHQTSIVDSSLTGLHHILHRIHIAVSVCRTTVVSLVKKNTIPSKNLILLDLTCLVGK